MIESDCTPSAFAKSIVSLQNADKIFAVSFRSECQVLSHDIIKPHFYSPS